MSDDRDPDPAPLTEDKDGPLGEKGWHAGATFFSESGGRPAQAEGQGSSGGAEPKPGDLDQDVHMPASEADTAAVQDDGKGEPQSWPGSSFGSIPPPG
jgi:hypothetical protein